MKSESEKQFKEKPRCYAVLSADIRFDRELSSTAKLIYAEIELLSRKSGYCFASNAYLAWLYGISERQVLSCIKALSERGYIKTERMPSGERRIFICAESAKKTSGEVKKTSEGGEENFVGRGEENFGYNNIKYNKYKNNNIHKNYVVGAFCQTPVDHEALEKIMWKKLIAGTELENRGEDKL